MVTSCMSPGSLETPHPTVIDATQALCDLDHGSAVKKGLDRMDPHGPPRLGASENNRGAFFVGITHLSHLKPHQFEEPGAGPWDGSQEWMPLPLN